MFFFNVFMRYPQTCHDRSTEFRITPRIRTGNSHSQVGQRRNVAGTHGRSDRRGGQRHTRTKFRQRRYLLSERDVRGKTSPENRLESTSPPKYGSQNHIVRFRVLAMSTVKPRNFRETLNILMLSFYTHLLLLFLVGTTGDLLGLFLCVRVSKIDPNQRWKGVGVI